jgi:hypothetical protein
MDGLYASFGSNLQQTAADAWLLFAIIGVFIVSVGSAYAVIAFKSKDVFPDYPEWLSGIAWMGGILAAIALVFGSVWIMLEAGSATTRATAENISEKLNSIYDVDVSGQDVLTVTKNGDESQTSSIAGPNIKDDEITELGTGPILVDGEVTKVQLWFVKGDLKLYVDDGPTAVQNLEEFPRK